MRLVVMGNSGFGKTTFAGALASATGSPLVSLDTIFWEPGGFEHARPESEQHRLLDAGCRGDMWIVEGVFGKLIERILPRVTCLVWLDVPLRDCLEGLHQRHDAQGIGLPASLAEWASSYHTRSGSSSHAAHRRIYEDFSEGRRHLVTTRGGTELLLQRLLSC